MDVLKKKKSKEKSLIGESSKYLKNKRNTYGLRLKEKIAKLIWRGLSTR
jgi:hypothetical protein